MKILKLSKKDICDFALERNKMLRKTSGEVVFFVDNDETISNKLKLELKRIQSKANRCKAYEVLRKNYFLGKYVGSEYIVRIGTKSSGRWSRKVHEFWKVKGKVGRLKGHLVHNTAADIRSYLKKIDKYSTLHAKENVSEKKLTSIYKIILFPALKFVITFVKSKNIVFSIMQSFHSYLSWTKQYFGQY